MHSIIRIQLKCQQKNEIPFLFFCYNDQLEEVFQKKYEQEEEEKETKKKFVVLMKKSRACLFSKLYIYSFSFYTFSHKIFISILSVFIT